MDFIKESEEWLLPVGINLQDLEFKDTIIKMEVYFNYISITSVIKNIY